MVQQRGARDATPADAPGLFRWECGPTGEIAWVDGAPRGPLIGRSIARPSEGDGDRIDVQVVRAFALRAPFRDAALTVAGKGPVAGEWKMSGVPAFEPADGRFAGYRGVALREAEPEASYEQVSGLLPDPDSLRELVHEIKTPLNAIIGFAEIIDGQYLGPADRRYRVRAAEIVAQARLLLIAIDDLDFAAKLSASAKTDVPRVNIGSLVEHLVPSLRQIAGGRGVELDASGTMRDLTAAVQPELADRLIMRLCSAVIERARSGERLRLSVDQTMGSSRVSISRPAALAGLGDASLFGAADDLSAQGFSLRLVRGLARIAGAELVTVPGAIALNFPRA
jgi:signal transduction histidine kinase